MRGQAWRRVWARVSRLRRYIGVALSGAAVNLLLFSVLLRAVGLAALWAWAVALEASLLWSFFWHDHITFSERNADSYLHRATRFHITAAVGVVLNFLAFFMLLRTPLLEELANAAAIGVAGIWNFSVHTVWSWRKNE